LSRGYALVEADEIAGYLRDPSEVDVGQGLTLTLSRGSLRARVE
ncbi:MAG TPA: exodeoxyribonuclease VII large subunit, partial [Planctomycetes bacterium]|nr:exodeoxyribonuclease VII large subunit [Planctomycetota bacterium]